MFSGRREFYFGMDGDSKKFEKVFKYSAKEWSVIFLDFC